MCVGTHESAFVIYCHKFVLCSFVKQNKEIARSEKAAAQHLHSMKSSVKAIILQILLASQSTCRLFKNYCLFEKTELTFKTQLNSVSNV